MPGLGTASLRLARPSRDLAAAGRFWRDGLGLRELHRHTSEAGEHSLLMLGLPDATWHLELTLDPTGALHPTPTPDDLLVLYLAGPVPDDLVARLERCGGTRVPAHNPYWDEWGVTVEDPDGYRLVLSTRDWNNARALATS
ncbi:VOC family protein (plasmid) [Streptomyces sp. BHT-5-2]|uniref:VOC family protein n=1 Tax=unclassified Streptomyces TaxID=2593676 RepID=UPI001C8DBCE1|nr:VOC family protein [Streptomyces sp. BHT-5-2]QZL07484.1 VOC family protein [Streptomyces sp. BHT-5-2]